MDRFPGKGKLSSSSHSQDKRPVNDHSPTFPNYLANQKKSETLAKNKKPSPFIAERSLSVKGNVPFLQQNKQIFQEQYEHSQPITDKKYFAAEKRRFDREKKLANNHDFRSYSLYKSRRPFRASEVPSLWKVTSPRRPKQIDYQKIKQELFVPVENLILVAVEKSITKEPAKELLTGKPHTSTVPAGKSKKALHRSLSGIIEQEKYQVKTKSAKKIQFEPGSPTGYSSYFD